MSQYPQPPPTYSAAPAVPFKDQDLAGQAAPLLGAQRMAVGEPGASSSTGGMGGVWTMPEPGELPDDFKYGTTVAESAPEVRNAFVRKVYTILFCQILATCVVGGVISQNKNAVFWVQTHTWAFYVPLFGTLINLGVLYWKRHSHPLNLFLLSSFTLLEAFTLGVVVAFYDNVIVLQAMLITLGVFLGLTLFTYQSKYDFSGMGPWLFGGLLALLTTGIVGLFIPFGQTMDLLYALGGTLIFSGYIVYDTYMISNRLSPDEFIIGAISLYLDMINLFLNILRLLNNLNRD